MKRRVLVVDDDPLTRDVVGTILDLEEFEVELAEDAESAIAVLGDATDVDVAVIDVMMPGMDGFELTRRIREDPATAGLPVILLTAKGQDADRARGAEVGCDAYMTKPFSPLALIDTIRSLEGRGEAR